MSELLEDIPPDTKPYKAVIGALVALATLIVNSVLDGHIDGGEVGLILGGVGAVATAVYLVRNPPKDS